MPVAVNLLLAKVHQKTKIALGVASSGIAATLLTGGRTTHLTFKLSLKCNISKGTAKAQVLQVGVLIVWDECTMSHKTDFEALDKLLQDRNDTDKVMGRVTLLMAGDFRQILPVVQRGTKAD